MARTLLAVDLSYQTYRAAAAHPMLTSLQRDGKVFTGGLYGFFVTWAKTMRETEATDVVFCQDRKPYLRSKSYPEYKQLRKANANYELKERYEESMPLVLEALDAFGLPLWGIDGFESDDLIGHLVMKYRHRYDRIVAASNDGDLYQLLWCPTFSIYAKDLSGLMTGAKLWEKHAVTPDQYMLATALTGTHNDIAGIPGVGPVTALKAIKDPALMRSTRAAWGQVIDRNLELIKLPHPEFPYEANLPTYAGGFNQRALYKWMSRYDIEVTMSMVNAFEQLKPRTT